MEIVTASGDNDNRDKAEQKQHSNKGHNNWDKDDDERNENSNRQSDPDSTRGQERAQERHSAKDDKDEVSNEPEHWYDIFKNNEKNAGLVEKEQRWWWPFN